MTEGFEWQYTTTAVYRFVAAIHHHDIITSATEVWEVMYDTV